MTLPDVTTLYHVVDATWPAAETIACGPVTLRRGLGGGSRVSAATGVCDGDDLTRAEAAMRDMGQPCLFQIRRGEDAFDAALAERGYQVLDPVTFYIAPIDLIAAEAPPYLSGFNVWPPVAVQRDIWASEGIGPERVAVMLRATCQRTTILGRVDERAAGCAYVGIHDGIAMFHALEVGSAFRRRGLATHMIRAMAIWARDNGAAHIALVVTQANIGANALYSGLGFSAVGHYHYRKLPE